MTQAENLPDDISQWPITNQVELFRWIGIVLPMISGTYDYLVLKETRGLLAQLEQEMDSDKAEEERVKMMDKLLELPEKYHELVNGLLNGGDLFGIILDDSMVLRDIVRLANEAKEIDRIADLILGNLAGTWTFNHKGLECGQNFPKSMGQTETSHWSIITSPLPKLSELLCERIGNCATYSITLAICLHCVGYDKVAICWGKMPHATEPGGWAGHLCVKVGDRLLDLTQRSHGAVECPGTYIEEGQLPL